MSTKWSRSCIVLALRSSAKSPYVLCNDAEISQFQILRGGAMQKRHEIVLDKLPLISIFFAGKVQKAQSEMILPKSDSHFFQKKSTLRLFSTFYFIKENHTSLRKKSTLGLPSNFYFIKAIHSSHFLDFRSAHF